MQRTLVALYDTSEAAQTTRDELVGLGVPSANIVVRGTESDTSGTMATGNEGYLVGLFLDEDRSTYEEGIRRGGHLLSAQVPDGMEDQAVEVLERSGAIDIDERAEHWRQGGWIGHQADRTSRGAGPAASTASSASTGYVAGERSSALSSAQLGVHTTELEGGEVLPVAEEELRVGKREVGRGGVRVRSYVTERPVEEQVHLRQERVSIERRPVNRELRPGDAAFQERTIEAVERGEEAVVSKTARVVEEIGIRKDVATETETVRDTVRRQDVEVEDERAGSGLSGGRGRFDQAAE